MPEKVGKSRNTVFFQWFGAPEGRKAGSLKRRVRSQLARWEMKKCTPSWREAHFQVKMYKTHQRRTTFGSWDVEKVYAVVARSTFPSQNVQSTTCSRHSWRFGCGKSARRCGAKHISKSNCTKHPMFGPLLEVQMSKKCMPLWREVHFEVKMLKTQGFGPLLEVQMSLHYTTLHYTPLQYTTLHYTTLHYTTLPSTTLHYTTLHSTTLQLQLQLHNYTPLHSTTLHYTTSHYTTLHYTTLPSTTLHYSTLHYIPLHYKYNYTTTQLHNYIPLHSTTLHYTTLHSTTLHYTPQHYN